MLFVIFSITVSNLSEAVNDVYYNLMHDVLFYI